MTTSIEGTTRMADTDTIAAPQYIDFHGEPSAPTAAGGKRWSARGQNFLVEYVEAVPGDAFEYDIAGEHVLIVPDERAGLSVDAGDRRARVAQPAVVVLPPGPSALLVDRATRFVHLVDVRDDTTTWVASNSERYDRPDPRVAGIDVLPRVADRLTAEVFELSQYPPAPGRFGTMFQSETFLVNILDPQVGPRDHEALSPHHHDDFEQCSLALEGEWVHHMRTPWGPRRSQWREDEHQMIGSPSVTIIPPPVQHTSEAVGSKVNQLIDIFCPVRRDFLDKGWVLNAGNYITAPR
ncbi:hypothetical protein JXX30_00295 [Rhodococcus erythropolis]|uniref:hypothetical protein n=1 Tax=Rhodococcus erythropolis TaxID=1833 RepID=UPI00197FFE66|nr:hypothetical protein [Rhodococcus erythropolis]QSE41316.1 hypothetical protein JXX30_00295 [Rhodococcus erythropolis]